MVDATAAGPVDLQAVVKAVRSHPGVAAKSEIGLVSEIFRNTDWLAGPGDDGAVVTEAGMSLVVGGEAILPSFVAADPYGAGVAAVTTNLNDLAAMGAWPLALVDTVTGPRALIARVMEGMRWASGLYNVPVVGGHLTVTAGPPGLSAFGLGRADRPLSARSARPGQSLVVGGCVQGRMRPDFPFFPSFDERGEKLAGDVRLLAEGAADGWVVAAKDVSMAGLVGSLAMLLECNGLGATVDLDALPVPDGVTVEQWVTCFPCLAFLMCVPDGREADCLRAFGRRGLAAAPVGTLDEGGELRLCSQGHAEVAFDLGRESVTNLARPAGSAVLPRPPGRRAARFQADEHALMRDARVLHESPRSPPAQPPEERDVCGLDVCLHLLPAMRPRPGDGEPHQRRAEAEMAVPRQHREAVALPAARFPWLGVEPDRPADGLARQPHDVDRCLIVVMRIGVVAGRRPPGAPEQPLLDGEHLVPDAEVGGPLGRGGYDVAGERAPARRPGPVRRRRLARGQGRARRRASHG
jgi:uncharacterized protein